MRKKSGIYVGRRLIKLHQASLPHIIHKHILACDKDYVKLILLYIGIFNSRHTKVIYIVLDFRADSSFLGRSGRLELSIKNCLVLRSLHHSKLNVSCEVCLCVFVKCRLHILDSLFGSGIVGDYVEVERYGGSGGCFRTVCILLIRAGCHKKTGCNHKDAQ